MATVKELKAKFSATADGFRQGVRAMRQGFEEFGDSTRQVINRSNDAFSNFESDLDSLGRDGRRNLEGIENSIDDVRYSSEDLEGSMSESKGSIIESFTGIKASVLAVGAALVGVVAGVYKFIGAGDELREALNHIEVNTNASKQEMQEMEDSLVSIYRNNYGESFQDIADAMARVRQVTGQTGKALEEATKMALLLRDSMGYDLNEGVRSADKLMRQFGITSDTAFALIAEGTKKGLNFADDLLPTIDEYSVYFKQAGYSASEMFGLFENAKKAGVFNLDYAADGFKEFGIIMTENSDRANTALKAIGLTNDKELRASFAKGGESAKQAMRTIADALANVKDPQKQIIQGVELFGTKFEDMGAQAVVEMTRVNDSIKGSEKALKEMEKVNFNSIGEAFKGSWRIINAELLIPLQQKVMPAINDFVQISKDLLSGFIKMMQGSSGSLIETITKNFSKDKQQPIIQFFLGIRDGIENLKNGATRAFEVIKIAAEKVWGVLGPYIMPLVQQIVTFVGEKIQQLKVFWDQYGSQFVQAIQNAFNMILSVIQFVMPAVMLIVSSVWNSIKGVIDGALKVIMGIVKVFTGLFTGNWSLLWEGVKQLLVGALQLLWNLFNLLMIGKLLGGIKAFITGGLGFFKGFALDIVSTFKGWIDNVISMFNSFRTSGLSIWKSLTSAIKDTVGPFVANIKSLFGEVLSHATTIFNNVKNAILHPIQTAKDTIRGIVGEIKGFFSGMKLQLPKIKMPHFKIKNWSKNPLDWLKAVPSLDIDWYAKGAIFTQPTLFNTPGGMKGFGDAGPEAAIPLTNSVLGRIGASIAATMPNGNLGELVSAIRGLASRPISIQIDGNAIVDATFDEIDHRQALNFQMSRFMRGK